MRAKNETSTTLEAGTPAPGRYEIDPAHSSIGFWARHMMVTKVRGRIGSFHGAIEVGDTPETSSVEVVMDAASIDTSMPMRDNHLRSDDFLDVERFPEMRFVSTRAVQLDETTGRIEGELTIRDVTRPVTLDVEYLGAMPDMSSAGQRLAFSAKTEIDREDWGITWNQALETGGLLVSRKVTIELEVAAVSAVEIAA